MQMAASRQAKVSLQLISALGSVTDGLWVGVPEAGSQQLPRRTTGPPQQVRPWQQGQDPPAASVQLSPRACRRNMPSTTIHV